MKLKKNTLIVILFIMIGALPIQALENSTSSQKESKLSNYETSLKNEKTYDEDDPISHIFLSMLEQLLLHKSDIDERLPKQYQTSAVKSYENFTGPYQFNYGTRFNDKAFDNKTGSQGSFSKRLPNAYNQDGTVASSIELGIDLKKFEESDGESTWEQVYVRFNNAQLYQSTSSGLGFKLGLGGTTFNDVTKVGFLFGTDYSFYDFLGNYSLHADYNAILYDTGASQFQLSIGSNMMSYIRLYLWKLNLDLGGEFKIINGDSETYSQQAFIRAGFRF
ncbi:hypothetical protein HOG98_03435 [bacterium]|nr:hypothetical protein [bacterium]